MPFDELQVGIKYYRRDRVCDGRSATGWLRRKFSSNYTETRKCHFCGKPGHLVMSCREKQIKDEMGKEANTNGNGKDDELLAKMLKDSADPLPLSQGDGTVRWQGVAV